MQDLYNTVDILFSPCIYPKSRIHGLRTSDKSGIDCININPSNAFEWHFLKLVSICSFKFKFLVLKILVQLNTSCMAVWWAGHFWDINFINDECFIPILNHWTIFECWTPVTTPPLGTGENWERFISAAMYWWHFLTQTFCDTPFGIYVGN